MCLLQIATRAEDFIADAIMQRGSTHRALAPVFTDGRIVKVVHGADQDVGIRTSRARSPDVPSDASHDTLGVVLPL